MNKGIEINKELLESIRLIYSASRFTFGESEDNNQIVPKHFTHDELISQNNIDENIVKFYYLPTLKYFTDEEYQKMVSMGYIGDKETTLKPFSVFIFGAYYTRIGLLNTLIDCKDIPLKINKNPIKYLNDLVPYFKNYSKGFEIGFSEFENECITPFLTMFPDKNDFIKKVFDYVTKHIVFSHSWLNSNTGIAINFEKEINYDYTIEYGKKQGFFYKAWTIIFSNNNLFAPLFKEYFNKKNKVETVNLNELSQNIDLTQLLKQQETLKFQEKRAKENVKAQENQVERQRERAEKGQSNTLAFEQKQLGLCLGELMKLKKEKSSLKIKIKALKINNVSKIQIQSQQDETAKPDELLIKNERIDIFKNDLGFTLFTKMYNLYKTEKTHLANFSYLFYAMEKDFLVCSQTDFIRFLESEKYNVSIEKIDSRQSGINKKSKLFNSIKEQLQKKHE